MLTETGGNVENMKKIIVRRISCVLVVACSRYDQAPLAMARFMFVIYSTRTARHNVSPTSVNNFTGLRERNKTDGDEMRPSYNDESRISFQQRANFSRKIITDV